MNYKSVIEDRPFFVECTVYEHIRIHTYLEDSGECFTVRVSKISEQKRSYSWDILMDYNTRDREAALVMHNSIANQVRKGENLHLSKYKTKSKPKPKK